MKILLATDGSTYSEAAVDAVINFGFPEDSQIKVVSIAEIPLTTGVNSFIGDISYLVDLQKIAKSNALKIIEAAQAKIREGTAGRNFTVTGEVTLGTPENRIVTAAEEMGADLIVVGSHGYNTWERLLLGSISDSVVHHAPCSVLVVRSSRK